MKKYLLKSFFYFSFICVTHLNAQWIQQTNGLPEGWGIAWSIDACDSNNAVISVPTNSIPFGIFITENGGNVWNNISPFSEDKWDKAIDISIVDKNHIWLACSSVDSARIIATTNGGLNWSTQYSDTNTTKFFNYIKMFDSDNGIAMGDAIYPSEVAIILQTSDGGNNWILVNEQAIGGRSGDTWRRVNFINNNIGFLFTSNLFSTLDGGLNWTNKNYTNSGISVMRFFNEKLGLTHKTNYEGLNPIGGLINRTTDGGNSWEFFEIEAIGWGNDIEFSPNDPSNVWFTDGPSLFYSVDTGRTWVEQDIFDGDLEGRDIAFTDDKHGWILCDNGKLFYTNNNGGVITEVEKEKPNTFSTEFNLEQNYPNPFNPTTIINYSIPPVANENFSSTTNVTLKIYDILGKEIATLVNEEKNGGNYSIEFNAKSLSSGIYYYQLKTENFVETKKMVLLR